MVEAKHAVPTLIAVLTSFGTPYSTDFAEAPTDEGRLVEIGADNVFDGRVVGAFKGGSDGELYSTVMLWVSVVCVVIEFEELRFS